MALRCQRLSVSASAGVQRPQPRAPTPMRGPALPARSGFSWFVDKLRMALLPGVVDQQAQVQQLQRKIGDLGQELDGQVAKLHDGLAELHSAGAHGSTHLLHGALPSAANRDTLLAPSPLDLDHLDRLAVDLRASEALAAQVQEQHLAALDAAAQLLADSERRSRQAMSYRTQLLALAQEAEASEAAARGRRRDARKRQRAALALAAQQRKSARARARSQPPAPDFVPAAPCARQVQFAVRCHTQVGQELLLVGGCPQLGAWDAAAALPMAWSDGHVWRARVQWEGAAGPLEFKALVRNADGSVTWERGGNRVVDVGDDGDLESFHVFAWA